MTDDMVLLYTDETHIRSYQALRATWAEVGKQKQIPTYRHHASVTLFGAVNVLNGKVITQQALACNTESFLEFVKRILQTYQGKYVLLVLDNARIHHAKQVQEFLREHEDQIMFFFLPPYSPQLNPIERLWKWLKESVIANRFHKDIYAIEQSVNSFLEYIEHHREEVLQRLGCAA
jgi:transposase